MLSRRGKTLDWFQLLLQAALNELMLFFMDHKPFVYVWLWVFTDVTSALTSDLCVWVQRPGLFPEKDHPPRCDEKPCSWEENIPDHNHVCLRCHDHKGDFRRRYSTAVIQLNCQLCSARQPFQIRIDQCTTNSYVNVSGFKASIKK